MVNWSYSGRYPRSLTPSLLQLGVFVLCAVPRRVCPEFLLRVFSTVNELFYVTFVGAGRTEAGSGGL